jgi:hypothetical protein
MRSATFARIGRRIFKRRRIVVSFSPMRLQRCASEMLPRPLQTGHGSPKSPTCRTPRTQPATSQRMIRSRMSRT